MRIVSNFGKSDHAFEDGSNASVTGEVRCDELKWKWDRVNVVKLQLAKYITVDATIQAL